MLLELNNFSHHFPDTLSLLLAQAGEDVTLVVLDELEGHGQVVILQHGLVIVDQCQL